MDKLFFILSLALYFLSPLSFSFPYLVVLLCLFLGNVLYIIWLDRKYETIGFNAFFSLSFFLVTYIYPVFIYQIMPTYSLFAYCSYNENIIVKSTALANLSYSCYGLGYIRYLKHAIKSGRLKQYVNIVFPRLVESSQLNKFSICEIILFGLLLLTGGLNAFKNFYSHENMGEVGSLFSQIWGIFQTFSYVLLISNFSYNRARVHMLLGGISIILLSVGTRTLPLNMMIVLMYFFCYKYKFSVGKLFSYGFLLFVILTAVGRFRSGNGTNVEDITAVEIGYFAFFEDFIVNSRNLYALYDYVLSHGITYGLSMIGYLLYVIPFGQSLFIALTGVSGNDMRSELVTGVIEGDSSAGLGTHIVGDVYLALGFMGIVLAFYYLGYLVSWMRTKFFNGSKYAYIIYMVLISGSIFMCRGALLYSFKNIVWSIVIIAAFGIKKRCIKEV